jgi:hypothetical protein
VLRRTEETVVLYARSGRVVTQHWADLAVAGMEFRTGTVLDGEAVIWRDGRLDFGAAQSRAASSVTRARALAARNPASYVCWDVLQHPDPAIGDLRSRPHMERRAYLLELLADLGPPIQAVPATDDREVALHWYEALQEQGIEGIVAHHLALAVGDEGGPVRLSARLEPVLARPAPAASTVVGSCGRHTSAVHRRTGALRAERPRGHRARTVPLRTAVGRDHPRAA